VVTVPGTLFAAAELIVPHDSRTETDWRQHFYHVRRWFFGAFLVFQVVATLSSNLLLQVPLTHPYRIAQAAELTVAVAGLLTARPKVHATLAVLYLAVLVIGQALFRFLPGLG
jgi:hypothetical protein